MAHDKMDELSIMLTKIFMALGTVTGTAGLALSDWDLRFAIVLKAIGIISGVFVILVNWEKATKQLKKFFKK